MKIKYKKIYYTANKYVLNIRIFQNVLINANKLIVLKCIFKSQLSDSFTKLII